MPDPGVSLIPRGSKSTKKRKTSFRPAAKKSNQNKHKSAAAASSKTKAAPSKKAQETTNDASQLVTDSVHETAKNNEPLSPKPQKKSTEEPSTNQVMSTPSRRTRSSSGDTSLPKTNSTRKRKAHALNNKISIGSSLRRQTEPAIEEAETDEKAPETSKDGEGKENAVVETKKKHALTSATIVGRSKSVPAFSEQDQAILNQLANEENEAESKTLTAFCTPFKGPKRKLKEKENAKDNKDTVKDAKSSAAEDSKGKRVDASTNGAPSVQIIDGQIVLQESSVVLPSRRTVQEVEEEFRDNVVEEDEQLNIVQASYTSFITKGDSGKTRKKGSWTIEETEKFYMALSQLGTDFGSMEALFFENQRTRKQLKNKYRRELAKNPDLVEELALNPKYQNQLDMAALSITVDPKRIEAHENEEPPAYEPTDVEEVVEETVGEAEKKETNESQADYNGVFDEREVVEEDAEEERLTEARAAKQKEKKTSSKSSARRKTEKEEKENPFAPEEGPSMDDFFGDSYGDDGSATNEAASTKKEPSAASSSKKKSATSKKETSVSLVPKKTNTKSRRPKIRPSRRKK